jgi:type II secretory pathway pseudopilin PulG
MTRRTDQANETATRPRTTGFALVTCLLLLTVFAILAVAGFTAALVEMRIASNLQERERAFQAAAFGIEQGLQAAALGTGLTTVASLRVPAGGGTMLLPASTADSYTYRLYFAGSTPSGLPPLHPAAALTAFHFVIEATGYSSRHATSTQVQSFKVLRPAGWSAGPANAACDPADAACVPLPVPGPLRTSWIEVEAE